MQTIKTYVVGNAKNYANWLGCQLIDSIKKADLVLFTGGEDVSPEFYGEKRGKYTHVNPFRDLREEEFFQEAQDSGKPMLGICRGGQFLTVMSGGKLIQHVTGHGGNHLIKVHAREGTDEKNWNRTLEVTSTHHQMFFPYDMDIKDYVFIASADVPQSQTYLNGDNEEVDMVERREPEILYYPSTRSLAIQCHPEFDTSEETLSYLRGLVNQLLNNSL